MLLLRLTVFFLSASQRLSCWLWPERRPKGAQAKQKHSTSKALSDSFDSQINNCNFVNDFHAFYDKRSHSIYCYDFVRDLYWSYQGGRLHLEEIMDAFDQGKQSPYAPDCLIDADSTVKGIPRSWTSSS